MKKIFKFSFLLVFSVIVFVIAFVFVVNLVTIVDKPVQGMDVELGAELQKDVVPFEVVFKKLNDVLPKVDSPQPIKQIRYDQIIFTKKNNRFDSRYHWYEKSAVNKNTQEVIYDVSYKIEKYIRRVGESVSKHNSPTAVVFVGCSFTMGEGVQFEESFVGLFEKNYPEITFYNLGRVGAGINDHLYQIQRNTHYLNHLDSKKHQRIILVYTFMSDHIFRESCSTRCLQDYYGWVLKKPRFALDRNQELILKGNHSNYFIKNSVTQSIFEQEFFLNRDFPPLFSETNLLRHRALINEFYQEALKRHNITDAYHFWGLSNNSEEVNKLYGYVDETKFKKVVLDYYTRDFRNNSQAYFIPYDAHPSAVGHQAMYTALLWRFKKDYPELFGR